MPPKKKEEEKKDDRYTRFGRMKGTLQMGIVGLPNVGKSSLFNLLTEQSVAADNYPFCTIDPTTSRCAVPDAHYRYLCDMWKPPSEYPAYLHVTDIAGLVKGAATGEGLGNAFLSHIQSVDGIYHVVRSFDDDTIQHVENTVDPIRDMEIILNELCVKDLEILHKARQQEDKDVKKSQGMKLSALYISTMDKVQKMLETNQPVATGEWTTPEVELINEKMSLITTKPITYLINLSSGDFERKKNKWLAKIFAWIQGHGGGKIIPFSIEFEKKLWDARADPAEIQKIKDDSKCESALPKMIVSGYESLALIHFYTAGEKEVRCWTIPAGATAPSAAGAIHSDIQKCFIKAEVVSFDDYKANTTKPSMGEVKAAGKFRMEGKTYVVQNGDIMHFQHNAKK